MLTWYKKIYLGDTVKEKAPRIIGKIKQGKLVYDVYLVTLAVNPKNLLEIVNANQLLQKVIRRRCPMIVGLASGYAEAEKIVLQIVKETYQAQGDTDVRRYLKEREKQQVGMEPGE